MTPGEGQWVEAYVVAARPVGAMELQEFCARHLAPFKVPRRIHFVPSLAQGTMGKPPMAPPIPGEGRPT